MEEFDLEFKPKATSVQRAAKELWSMQEGAIRMLQMNKYENYRVIEHFFINNECKLIIKLQL